MAKGNRIRILVTGFGPYPGTPENPSEHLVRALAERNARPPAGTSLTTHILPTSWTEVARLMPAMLAEEQPDVAIHFGHAAKARGFRLEEVARNRTAAMADVDGRLPARTLIAAQGPRLLRTDVPLDTLQLRLRALALSTELSQNAGNYLCNNVYYLSMTYAKGRLRPALSLFVHIPPASFFQTADALEKGAAAIIRACVELRRRGSVKAA